MPAFISTDRVTARIRAAPSPAAIAGPFASSQSKKAASPSRPYFTTSP